MSRDPYKTGPNYRLPIAVAVVAALLIGGILILAGGNDDPVSEALVPPVASDSFTAEEEKEAAAQAAAQSGAIDGAPLEASEIPPGQDHEDHHHLPEPPADQATNAGPLLGTATRFAELMINRPTDQLESAELNKELITLAYGTLAAGLRDATGEIATAQAPSSGKILDSILLTQQSDYAEVLIVAEESLIDPTTRQKLDPRFINYVVRLDRVAGKGWAVTSWEPQL